MEQAQQYRDAMSRQFDELQKKEWDKIKAGREKANAKELAQRELRAKQALKFQEANRRAWHSQASK